jgi:hypothetical protein
MSYKASVEPELDDQGRKHGISMGYRNNNGMLWWKFMWTHGWPTGIDKEWNLAGNLDYAAYQLNRNWEGERIKYYYE